MAYSVDVMIAMEEGQVPTPEWWFDRYAKGMVRAGGYPPEIPGPDRVKLQRQSDPDTSEEFVRITLPMPVGTSLGRVRELAHMLSSVLVAEGFTMRSKGKLVDELPGELTDGTIGGLGYTEARVCAGRCMACIFSTDTRVGCCGQGGAWSLADVGAALLDGGEEFIASCLALPGEMDGVKWHPHLAGGACTYHDPSCGCTLPPTRMPLQCRTYLCLPDKLLPAPALAEYSGYVDALEEAEYFIEQHMRHESGVDFGSPLPELKAAAARAFAAWQAGS